MPTRGFLRCFALTFVVVASSIYLFVLLFVGTFQGLPKFFINYGELLWIAVSVTISALLARAINDSRLDKRLQEAHSQETDPRLVKTSNARVGQETFNGEEELEANVK